MNRPNLPENKKIAEPESVYAYTQYNYICYQDLNDTSIFQKRLTAKERFSLPFKVLAAKNKYRQSINHYNQLLSEPFGEAELIDMFKKDHELFLKKEEAHKNLVYASHGIQKNEYEELKNAEQSIASQIEKLRLERENRVKKPEENA